MIDFDLSAPIGVRPIMLDDPKKLSDGDNQSAFLEQFAFQAIRNALAVFDVTARQEGVARTMRLRQQKMSLVLDHGSSEQVNGLCFHLETLTDCTALHARD